MNDTSNERPCFTASRSSTDSPKRDWYWWRRFRASGLVFAASTLAVIPVIAVYVAGQKHPIAGITAGAVK